MDAKREQEWKDQAQSRFPKFAYGEIAGAVFEAAYASMHRLVRNKHTMTDSK